MSLASIFRGSVANRENNDTSDKRLVVYCTAPNNNDDVAFHGNHVNAFFLKKWIGTAHNTT